MSGEATVPVYLKLECKQSIGWSRERRNSNPLLKAQRMVTTSSRATVS